MSPFLPDMADEEPAAFVVVLPWPDQRLSPNARLHWRAKAPVTADARADAHKTVLEAAGASLSAIRASLAGDGKIPARITFYPPDKRHRDDDGMIGAFKAARDGMADALKVNDRRFQPHYFFEEAEKPGRVEVVLGPLPGDARHAFAQAPFDAVNGLPPEQQEAA